MLPVTLVDPSVYNHLTHDKQLEVVRQNGFNIKHITYQSEELQIAAVTSSPNAIWSIRSPCIRAIHVALSTEWLILEHPNEYAELLSRLYSDSGIMVNKWLRYAESIRRL